jgi:hypothetical protein
LNGPGDMLDLRRLRRGGVIVEAMQILVCALMHVLDPDLEVGSSLGDGLHLYDFTGLHAINQVIACSFIFNRNLACGEGIGLDSCDVIATTSDYGISIIKLGILLCHVVLLARSYQCIVCATWATWRQWSRMCLD